MHLRLGQLRKQVIVAFSVSGQTINAYSLYSQDHIGLMNIAICSMLNNSMRPLIHKAMSTHPEVILKTSNSLAE